MQKNILSILLLAFLAQTAAIAQDLPPNLDKGPQNPYPFIPSMLLKLHEKSLESPVAAVLMAQESNMLTKDGKVYVEVVHGGEDDTHFAIDNEMIRNLPNVEMTTTFVNRTSAWVPVDQLLATGQLLPQAYRLSEVVVGKEDNEGPGLMNSDDYSGPGGAGRIIAIIDSGFQNLTAARNAGAAPTVGNTTAYDYPGGGIETVTPHGTGCLESAFDHAPDATYNIFKTGSLADMGTAVTQCIANGVDVISHSMSRYNTGWADNSGAACAAVANASNNGILFCTSAGNRNGTHWQGDFVDGDNDNWHNWSGGDERNNFTVNDNGQVWANLQWNSGSGTNHYDLYLYNASNNSVLASSTNTNAFESIVFNNNSGSTMSVYLAVWGVSANPPEFEVFNHDSGCSDFEYVSTTGSSTSPSNSTAATLISVGAVPRTSYNSAAGTSGIIANYSSRGPTNSGNQAPDVCAPTNTTTVAYGGGFSGTSCSCPNTAGAAAAFWSGHTALNASGVRQIMLAKAKIYKDWGTAGADNIYGQGGVFLHDYSSLNRYILKSANNVNSLATLPYYGMADVDDDAGVPTGRILLYLDTSDITPTSGNVISRNQTYKSVVGTIID